LVEANLPFVAAAVQTMLARDNTDASFHASMKAAASPEPGLLLILASLWRLVAGLGQNDSGDTDILSKGLIVKGVNPSVTTGLPGRMAELLTVSLERWLPLLCISRVALQDSILGDKPTFDLVQPDLMAKLDWLVGFAPTNDVAVRLEYADQLLTGWHRLASKDTPLCLVQYLSDTWQKGVERMSQPGCGSGFLLLEHR
jgi:hypothetical protein